MGGRTELDLVTELERNRFRQLFHADRGLAFPFLDQGCSKFGSQAELLDAANAD